jgi:hypothetical protein
MKAVRVQCEAITYIPDGMSLAVAEDRASALIKLAMQEIGITVIQMLEVILMDVDE